MHTLEEVHESLAKERVLLERLECRRSMAIRSCGNCVRSHADGGEIPAIALTAYTRELDRHQAQAAGYQRHIPKPVQIAALVEAIEELVCERRRIPS